MSTDQPKFVPIAAVTVLNEDGIHPCTVGSRVLLLCRASGQWHAVSPWCTHAGADLSGGHIVSGKIVCPLHGAAFHLKNGAPATTPASRKLQTFPLRIVDDTIEVAIDTG